MHCIFCEKGYMRLETSHLPVSLSLSLSLMHSHVCMYVCVYIYICMYACMYVCIFYMYILYIHTRICICVWIHMYIYVYMYVCVFIYLSRKLALWSLRESPFTNHLGSGELGQDRVQDLIWSFLNSY